MCILVLSCHRIGGSSPAVRYRLRYCGWPAFAVGREKWWRLVVWVGLVVRDWKSVRAHVALGISRCGFYDADPLGVP